MKRCSSHTTSHSAYHLLLTSLLLVSQVAGTQNQQQSAEASVLLSNLPMPQQLSSFQTLPTDASGKYYALQIRAAARLSGSRFVPFTLEEQETMIRALQESLLSGGPVELESYREFWPDTSAPLAMRDPAPGAEFSIVLSRVIDISGRAPPLSSAELWKATDEAISVFAQLTKGFQRKGLPAPELIFASGDPSYINGTFTLSPLLVLVVELTLELDNTSGPLSAQQATVVAGIVRTHVLGAGLGGRPVGTVVEVAMHSAPSSAVSLEVTMFHCTRNASTPSPGCEQQVLEYVLAQVQQSEEAAQLLQAAGIKNVAVGRISQRVIKPLLPRTPDGPWIPWHLDRIDQREQPLDGRYTANATGAAPGGPRVSVYIISSGIRGDHEEFGGRVVSEWGYLGLDPLGECSDAPRTLGRGTFFASLCCGEKLGVAKGVSIHSVRFRERCTGRDERMLAEGALPAAMDLVLSKAVHPAVVLLDFWWYPIDLDFNSAYILSRLDLLLKKNITVVAGVGYGPYSPCKSIITTHPVVLTVAASDLYDQSSLFNPAKPGGSNSSSDCVDVYAPSGGLGVGLWGAGSSGRSNYTRAIAGSMAAAPIVAGVVAQYLQYNPDATPAQVHQAFMKELPTHNIITGAGLPNALLYTNFTQAPAQEPGTNDSSNRSTASSGSSSLSGGWIAGIVVAACAGLAALAFAAFTLQRRRGLLPLDMDSKAGGSGWEIQADQVEILHHPDTGSEWLLGQGSNGKVFKAMKGGVQPVAVKVLTHIDGHFRQRFVKEMEMWRAVSRDANVTQFYGAVVQGGGTVMLVAEYMEGGDLYDALAADATTKELTWWQHGKRIMLDVVRGLAFLHSNQIVHRDIKSKNILLGAGGRAKLADVGLAQLLGEGRSTSPTAFVGTLAWAAPEVLCPEAGVRVSEKADIWAAGVVLWEIVTHERPLRGALREPRVPEECPQEVAAAMQACMQQDPERRPTAKELYALLLACPPSDDSRQLSGSSTSKRASERGSPPWLHSGSGNLGNESGDVPLVAADSGQVVPGSDAKSFSNSDMSLVVVDFSRLQFVTGADGGCVQLGSGGYGTVWKVLLDGVQPLAAKAVELGNSSGVHGAFVQEARLLWVLRHPNIVPLTGVSISQGHGYLLMEICEGGSLLKQLNRRGSSGRRLFSWYERGKSVAIEVAQGLHYLHSMGITHFDVTAGNVLLTRHLTARVSDVGLARITSATHHSLNHASSACLGLHGTFPYMAPELMAGTQCTSAVDVFSFGVLLHEICTGVHPERGRMQSLKVPGDAPQQVVDLYMQCVATHPAARPTARELVERLSQAAGVSPPADAAGGGSKQQGLGKGTELGGKGPPHVRAAVVIRHQSQLVDSPFKELAGGPPILGPSSGSQI